jgi:hypothetical protein
MDRWYARAVRRMGLIVAMVVACTWEPEPAASSSSKEPIPEAQPSKCPPQAPPSAALGTDLAARIGEAKLRCRDAGIEPSAEHDQALSGRWSGSYGYGEPGRRRVEIEGQLLVTGGIVAGTFTEPNTFALDDGPVLSSTLTGEVQSGGRLVLQKTYLGGADADHSILYIGQLSEDGRKIEGHWRLAGSTGPFELER